MKQSTPLFLIGLFIWLAGLTIFQFIKPQKIAYVETNKVLKEYIGAKDAKEELKVEQQLLKNQLDSLMNDWQNELKSYEKERSSYSSKEKKLKEQLLSSKQNQINNFQQVIQAKLQEKDQQITQTIFNEINDFMKDYGKKKGYKYILGANGSGNVVYADEAQNITEEVIEGLNKK